MEFIRTKEYVRGLKKSKVSAANERSMLQDLAENPERGDVIPHASGIRKIRVASCGRGKRGGARVIYCYIRTASRIYLLSVYDKSRIANLSQSTIQVLAALAKQLKQTHHEN